ncbi:MAG: SDR family NAD(P)-dependent oxidoreductase [Spirochaetales bacterium]|uniref:SDR family NAD(P)-dependent oxidoreductase n=1 Tax=Candidatus Thalassospirochaeta sargassi TaxID=3119039 RepID=A0AAJ1IGX7_9SPIO|nr:SDR family NAD(P)-dependent oxidoreductase [Spirochaetales bacterium]
MNIKWDFTGRNYVVTGSTRGIGFEIAMQLMAAGAAVGITGRDSGRLAEIEEDCRDKGYKCFTAGADLTRASDLTTLADSFINRMGCIDGLVNNAGINILEPADGLSLEAVEKVIKTNLTAPMILTSLFTAGMKKQGGGSVVNVASLSSKTAFMNHSAYCASKEGLLGYTKVAAMELGSHNIRVNSVGPTVVLTELGKRDWNADPEKRKHMEGFIPLNRFVEPEEVASAVLFLLSDEAAMISGEFMLIDGGYMAGKGI